MNTRAALDAGDRDATRRLYKQLVCLQCAAHKLRVQSALERGVAVTQLHEVDAQYAHAQVKYGVPRKPIKGPMPAAPNAPSMEQPTVEEALKQLGGVIHHKKMLLLHAHLHDSWSAVVADVRASLKAVRNEIQVLKARHHVQLGALYDALVKKRLTLRLYLARTRKLRGSKLKPHEGLARVMASKLTLQEQAHDGDEEDTAMLEDTGEMSDGEAQCDADVDEDESSVVYEHASI